MTDERHTDAPRADPVTADGLVVAATREFQAPRQLVWDAMTKPEHLRATLAPYDETVTVLDIDLRVGGDYHYVFVTPDGIECSFRGGFREVDHPARIVQTWHFDGWPEVWAVQTDELSEADGVTTLTTSLTFANEADRAHMRTAAGIEANLDKLVELVDTLAGQGEAAGGAPTPG